MVNVDECSGSSVFVLLCGIVIYLAKYIFRQGNVCGILGHVMCRVCHMPHALIFDLLRSITIILCYLGVDYKRFPDRRIANASRQYNIALKKKY